MSFPFRESFGRRRIETSEVAITSANLLDVLAKAEAKFAQNREDCRFLFSYYLGRQPILDRIKDVRPEILNKPVENHAQEITGFYNGYIFGQPCVYVYDGVDQVALSDDVQRLNNTMARAGKPGQDRVLGEWVLTTGVGYRIIVQNPDYIPGSPDDLPFITDVVDSDMAYVVRSSGVGHRPLLGVMHIRQDNGKDLIVAYTKDTYYEVRDNQIVQAIPHTFGHIPIVEYELNPERMGVFEPVIPLLDQLNNLLANRCDGVEQFVQSFIKFVNCEIDEETFAKMKSLGAIAIRSSSGLPADMDMVSAELNQSQVQVLVDYVHDQICNITGLPSTKGGGASTSDNVGAVIVRNGWNQTEARAQSIESMWRVSEIRFLQVALNILRDTTDINLNVSDLGVVFPRRQYDNIQSKATVFSTLLSQPIDPAIAFEFSGIFPDPQSKYEASKPFLVAAGKLGQDGNAPEPQVQQPDQTQEEQSSGEEPNSESAE